MHDRWIEANVPADTWNKCAEVTQSMLEAFPELKRVRGHVMLGNGIERPHWWLVDAVGAIVDPTKRQFYDKDGYYGGVGVVLYTEWDESQPEPTGKCANCGGYIYHGRDTVCSDECHRSYVAYLMSNRF